MKESGEKYRANERVYLWFFGGERIMLRGSEIMYLHTEQRKVYIHTRHNVYRIRGSLKDAVSRLSDLPMIKTHASYVVHLDHLEKISSHSAVLKNGEEIPVSARCWREAKPEVDTYFGNQKCVDRR
ncbi:MAG: LytTR family transcriptional regulator [Clostridiales bacterium]|nr:LytTR family transcriptional regulator [Clostridiales bacterium]